MPKIIEAVYENGVFKPLQKVDLKEGEKVKLQIEEGMRDIKKYRGVLGKANARELLKFEEEVVL